MNIQKYYNRKLVLIIIGILAVSYFFSDSEKSNELDNLSQKNVKDNITNSGISKIVITREFDDDKISTNIGKKNLKVNSYYVTEDEENNINKSLFSDSQSSVNEKWTTPKPNRKYQISVLLPHLEDSYWITADYAIVNYARELGVEVKIYSADGYIEIGNQREQLQESANNSNIDGIILASVDYKQLDSEVENIIESGKPVVELINNINTSKIKAKSLVSFYEMGYKAGKFAIDDAAGKDIKVAFFPGPERSGWAPDTFQGFKDAISNFKSENQEIDISEPYYGDTRMKVQLLRIASVLGKNDNYDYIVGCAPAAIEAEGFISKNKEKFKNTKIISTYITQDVYELIKKGTVLAAPSDQIIEQCRISLDMIVRCLNGEKPGVDFPFQSSPEIPIISQSNISKFNYEDLFGKKDYIPVLNHIN